MCPVVDGSAIQEFEQLPEGIYPAKLEKWENKETKSGDSINVNMTFVVTEGECEGRKGFLSRNLKPQSLWSFKKTAVALGADPEAFVGEFDTDEIMVDLVGEECRIKVEEQKEGDYAGRTQITDVLAAAYALK